MTGLTPGNNYAVRVCARRTRGRGCAWTWVRPNAAPGRTAAPTVTTASRSSLRVAWSAPSNTGTAINDYDIRYRKSTVSTWSNHVFRSTGRSTTIPGLTADVAYDVQVRAGNAHGEGLFSPSSRGTPHGRPRAPAAPTVAAASATSLSVRWRAPYRGDAAIFDYDVRYRASGSSSWRGRSFTGTGTSTTITGLTKGTTYAVQVRARNRYGSGAFSPSGSGAPNQAPGRPATPTLTTASASAFVVGWRAPANAGTAITNYDVRYKLRSAAAWRELARNGTGTSVRIGGLIAGRVYQVQVRAGNAHGKGRYSATAEAAPNEVPGRPVAPSVTASGSSLAVSWSAPSNRGTAITDYDVRYKRRSATTWTDHAHSGTGTTATIGSLRRGTTYDVQVRAGNAHGEGSYSPSGSATLIGRPSAPAAPNVAAASPTSLRVTWTAPAANGAAITDYDVRYKRSTANAWTSHSFAGTGTATTISGLTTGTAYHVQVRAANSHGESAYSPSGTGTPNRVPGRPRAPTVRSASASSLQVSWSAPSNSGSAITDYDVRYKRSSATSWTAHPFTGTGRSTTIGGLVTGAAYSVQVRAGNAGGEGSYSPSGTGTPNEKPGRPAAPTVTAASRSSLAVSWTAPANRGTAITDYDVQYKLASASAWTERSFSGTGTATTISGLVLGQPYNVRVRAGNAAGEGSYSPAGVGTPDEKPGRPAAPVVAPAATDKLSVRWTAPANRGTAITDYDVRYKLASAAAWSSHPASGTSTATTIAGLIVGQSYQVQVRAGNAAGEGAYSASGTGSPADVPGFTAEYDFGAHAIVLAFDAPPAQFYQVRTRVNASDAWTRKDIRTDEYRMLNPTDGATYGYQARNCEIMVLTGGRGRGVRCGPWSATVELTVDIHGPFEPEPALVTTTVPGSLPYDTGVTKGGDAYVNIPILPVPGVGGLAPRLSIDYGGGRERQRLAEHQPADLLGYGWRIGGLSAIQRCVVGKATSSHLLYGPGDNLCLDGELLVLAKGAKWAVGSEYRTYRESFVKVAAMGSSTALWFEARLPDGTTRQYGNSADSRLRGGATFHHDLAWSLNRETDAFGNAMTYEYHEDEVARVRQPKRIAYGNGGDAELEFLYAARADTAPVSSGGAMRTRHLLLHTVRAKLDGWKVREYRLLSETHRPSGCVAARCAWRRLEGVQLCGYDEKVVVGGPDESGAGRQCLRALDVDWMQTTGGPAAYKTCVDGVTDPLGRKTEFSYGKIASASSTLLFRERPFGEATAPADAQALAAEDGAVKPVVTAVTRQTGVPSAADATKEGVAELRYAYQGLPLESALSWGLLGFAATRATDATNGTVTYLQHRLDDPHFAALSAEHRYDGVYGGMSTKTLSKRYVERAAHALRHAPSDGATTTKVPYARRETVLRYENGTALGATRTQWTHTFSAAGLPTRTVRETTAGTGSLGTLSSSAAWGSVPAYTFASALRRHVATFDLGNRTTGSQWLVGFVCQETEAHHRGAGATAERTLWTAYAPRANTMAPASARRFGTPTGCAGARSNGAAPAGLALTASYGYDGRGNRTSETVSGGNVASRTSRLSAFADGRWPGAATNALGHVERFVHDARFGLPKTATDANGRTTTRRYDPFGRLAGLTTPDGVAFTVARHWCGAGFRCATVDGAAPAMAVQVASSPQAAPTATRYLDKLGRVVRAETQAFSGGSDIREDVRHDARGRVLRRSAPCFDNATAPNTSYRYDVLDRPTRETRPDRGETAWAYAVGTGGATTVTATEKVYRGTTLAATLTTATSYSLLGEVASVTEASGAAAAAAATYAYDASGLLKTVTVGGTEVARFAYDAAGNRTSATRPDAGATTFAHTALGQARTVRNALGQTATYAYDALGRLASRSDPDGKAYWTYDPANGKGRLHRRCRGSTTLASCAGTPDFVEELAYGTDARPSSATTAIRADGQPARTYVRRFGYDRSGRLSTESHPSGATTLREYNGRGYLEAVKDNATQAVLERYGARDAFGSVASVAHGNGFATARTFDANTGRLTGVETTRGSGGSKTTALDFDYVWRSDGALHSRAAGTGSAKRAETFARDALGRLTGAAAASGTSTRSLAYGYDALGSLLNRTSTAAADRDVALSGHSSTATAAPGPHAPRFAVAGTERRGLSYDAAGRQTAATVCAAASGACAAKSGAGHRHVTWNARGEATRVLVGDGPADATPTLREDFARGPDGVLHFRRSAWRVDGAERVERRYRAGGFEEVVPAASASSTYAWARKTLVADSVLHVKKRRKDGTETSHYEHLHRDHLGSVAAVTGPARTVSREAAHDPFGARRAADWTRALTAAERAAWADGAVEHSTQGFAGHDNLDRMGLVDMGGRLYDPELGQFLSPDPVVSRPYSTQGWNPYSYVGNRPLSRVDPDGRQFAPAGCNLGGVLCPGGGGRGGAPPGGHSARPTLATSVNVRVFHRLRVGWGWGWGWGGPGWGGDSGWGGFRPYPTFHFERMLAVDVATSRVHSGTARHPRGRAAGAPATPAHDRVGRRLSGSEKAVS